MASWELHKYYRGVVIPMIKDRLNFLKACPFQLNNIQTHQLIKRLIGFETSAKFDNKKYLEFLEEVWCIGAHIGIVIPDPNEPTEMQKIEELSQAVLAVYTTIRPFISSNPLNFQINDEVNLMCTQNSAKLMCYAWTDHHLEVSVFAFEKQLTTLNTTIQGFNDSNVYKTTKDLSEVFKNEIEPMCNKENRLTSINKRIEILQSEKEELENEN